MAPNVPVCDCNPLHLFPVTIQLNLAISTNNIKLAHLSREKNRFHAFTILYNVHFQDFHNLGIRKNKQTNKQTNNWIKQQYRTIACSKVKGKNWLWYSLIFWRWRRKNTQQTKMTIKRTKRSTPTTLRAMSIFLLDPSGAVLGWGLSASAKRKGSETYSSCLLKGDYHLEGP